MLPEHLNDMTDQRARQLSQQLRVQMIQSVAKTGGHLASNLGVVEILVAVHRVFDLDVDRLVFDVGHQCYAHKILTGRGSAMHTLRKFGGLSGFPKPYESRADAFISGHASNSVSVALGMARARTVRITVCWLSLEMERSPAGWPLRGWPMRAAAGSPSLSSSTTTGCPSPKTWAVWPPTWQNSG